MATVPSGQKFHTVASTVETNNLGSKLANSQREIFTMQDITSTVRPYKVFTALLTQSGGTNFVNQTNGIFTIGVTYIIDAYNSGDDFSNVGGPASSLDGAWDGYSFMATGTTPLVYVNGTSIDHDLGAPVAIVLENTIGNVWFTYADVGNYSVNSNGLFTLNKTVNTLSQTANISGLSDTPYYAYCNPQSQNLLEIVIVDNTLTTLDDLLISKLIEIRVYE